MSAGASSSFYQPTKTKVGDTSTGPLFIKWMGLQWFEGPTIAQAINSPCIFPVANLIVSDIFNFASYVCCSMKMGEQWSFPQGVQFGAAALEEGQQVRNVSKAAGWRHHFQPPNVTSALCIRKSDTAVHNASFWSLP